MVHKKHNKFTMIFLNKTYPLTNQSNLLICILASSRSESTITSATTVMLFISFNQKYLSKNISKIILLKFILVEFLLESSLR